MTDPRDPDKPEAPTEGEHPTLPERLEQVEQQVEHAAEEVAEEVAEHVPAPLKAPVRWTVKRLVLVIGLAAVLVVVVGALATAYYVWNHTQWASHELAGRVNNLLHEHSNVELSIAGVRGNPLSSVEVLDPRIRFRDDPADAVLRARAMRLSYSSWNLLAAKRGALVIELDHPVFIVSRGADGKLRIPSWKPGAARAGGPGRGYDVVLRIRDGELRLPDPDMSIAGLGLDANVATGGPTRVAIRSLSWDRGIHGLALQRLRGDIAVGDSVRIEVAELKSSDLVMSGRIRWKRDETLRDVGAHVERLRWAWLARVFANQTLDVPGEGTFDVVGRGDRTWDGEVRGHALWDSLPLETRANFIWNDGRLVLDPLSGKSPAGRLVRGRLSWSKKGWDIEGLAAEADPAHWGAIGLHGWPEGRLNGRFNYAVDTRVPGAPSSRLEARMGSSSWSGWSADSAVVTVVMPAAAPDSFRVRATRRGGLLTLAARVNPDGWGGPYRIERFPLDEWPDGRASGISGVLSEGEGRIDVSQGEMRVTGTLAGTSTRWFGADAARWRLDEVRGRLMPTPDLDARARLEDVFYLGLHFDSAGAPVHLGDQTLAFPGLKAFAGDSVLTMTASARWSDAGWRLIATQAAVRSSQFAWEADPPLEISGDDHGVTFDRVSAADGDARLTISGRWAQPGGTYDWHARAQGLRLDRLGMPRELKLGGTAVAELAVTGVSGDPRWSFEGQVSRPAMQGHVGDSLSLRLGGAPARLDVEQFRLGIAGGAFEGQGEVRGMERPWPDTLTAGGVTAWIARAGSWNGKARADQVPLERLTALARSDAGWSGRLGGTLALTGRPSQPEFEVVLEARPVAWRTLKMDAISTRARYRDERLTVSELRMTRDQVMSSATGEVDIRLALGQEPKLLDAPMRWQLNLPNGDLALAPLLVPQVGVAAGRVEVDAQVRGTPRNPELYGRARIRDGRLRIAGRDEVLDKMNATFRFEGSKVMMDSLTASQRTAMGGVGRVRGTGSIDLRANPGPAYAFDLALRDFTAVETDVYAARFEGDFHIVNGRTVGGHVLPHVTSDNVEIRNAVISYDFTRQTEQQQVQASTAPLYWTYRIQVHANDNLFWRPTDGDIEFSADLSLDQSPEGLLIFGDMQSLRGTYYFLSNRFTVNRANLTFDDVGGVDPLVDASAVTNLSVQQRNVDGSYSNERTTITVNITGRSSRPTVSFQSSPLALYQDQILQQLTVGRFVQGQQVALSDPLDSYLTRAISRQLSAELSRAFRGYVTEWEIARESQGPGGFFVRARVPINERLSLRYGERLPGTERGSTTPTSALVERDIEAEYRLNRFFYITSQLSQKRLVNGSTSNSSTTPDFNVNLKARWEY